jgi:hypothetical protein
MLAAALPQHLQRTGLRPSAGAAVRHIRKHQEPFLRITAQMTIGIAAIFAAICFGVAITGFSSLGSFADPVQAADAKGFAWFWAFLGAVGVVLGASALWVLRTQKDGEDA